MISAFDLFKIGIGPSSSHTVGPMVAARRFKKALDSRAVRVRVELFGSLAWTGKGHGSDTAICLGMLDEDPATVDPDKIAGAVAAINTAKAFWIDGGHLIAFDPGKDLIFDLVELLPAHSNGMRFRALAADGSVLLEKVYYSIGGGFVSEEGAVAADPESVPYPFSSSVELLDMCAKAGLSISDLQLANEIVSRPLEDVECGLDRIRDAMFDCIDRGLHGHGVLPGKLKVKRRARTILEQLEARQPSNQKSPHEIMDWISVYAIAVNEENAAGGRVVTAPTNGAAGIVPAVLRYYRDFCEGYSDEQARIYLLSATAIGSLIKRNASISGAEVGCQGEVGSAAAMAAAGLAAGLGASPEQIENAAEIAMEHHLGMTCDPIGGLVQIPCIERNAFGANKAIAAASLALKGDGTHHVSLDAVVETMRQTGADMQSKYKETSLGGLAVNVPEC
jgi:L-serine dehydratase